MKNIIILVLFTIPIKLYGDWGPGFKDERDYVAQHYLNEIRAEYYFELAKLADTKLEKVGQALSKSTGRLVEVSHKTQASSNRLKRIVDIISSSSSLTKQMLQELNMAMRSLELDLEELRLAISNRKAQLDSLPDDLTIIFPKFENWIQKIPEERRTLELKFALTSEFDVLNKALPGWDRGANLKISDVLTFLQSEALLTKSFLKTAIPMKEPLSSQILEHYRSILNGNDKVNKWIKTILEGEPFSRVISGQFIEDERKILENTEKLFQQFRDFKEKVSNSVKESASKSLQLANVITEFEKRQLIQEGDGSLRFSGEQACNLQSHYNSQTQFFRDLAGVGLMNDGDFDQSIADYETAKIQRKSLQESYQGKWLDSNSETLKNYKNRVQNRLTAVEEAIVIDRLTTDVSEIFHNASRYIEEEINSQNYVNAAFAYINLKVITAFAKEVPNPKRPAVLANTLEDADRFMARYESVLRSDPESAEMLQRFQDTVGDIEPKVCSAENVRGVQP